MNRLKLKQEKSRIIHKLKLLPIWGILLTSLCSCLPLGIPYQQNQVEAKSTEARNNLGVMNRAQIAYFLEHNKFANTVPDFQLDLPSQTTNYRYSIKIVDQAAFHYGISRHTEFVQPEKTEFWGFIPQQNQPEVLKSYLGVVWLVPESNTEPDARILNFKILSILCESTSPHILEERYQPIFDGESFHCPEEMVTKDSDQFPYSAP